MRMGVLILIYAYAALTPAFTMLSIAQNGAERVTFW